MVGEIFDVNRGIPRSSQTIVVRSPSALNVSSISCSSGSSESVIRTASVH
jgi:hypothetical protein